MIVKKKNTAKNNSNSFVNRVYKKNGANWRHFAVVTGTGQISRNFMEDLKRLAYWK
jgi:hypothetical protein